MAETRLLGGNQRKKWREKEERDGARARSGEEGRNNRGRKERGRREKGEVEGWGRSFSIVEETNINFRAHENLNIPTLVTACKISKVFAVYSRV
jgi:hypothetical protein